MPQQPKLDMQTQTAIPNYMSFLHNNPQYVVYKSFKK